MRCFSASKQNIVTYDDEQCANVFPTHATLSGTWSHSMNFVKFSLNGICGAERTTGDFVYCIVTAAIQLVWKSLSLEKANEKSECSL